MTRVAAALLGAALPLDVQLAVAALLIGGVGLAHGAGDLASVPVKRRRGFVVAYLTVAATCVGWWAWRPGAALPLFLAASTIHFGLDDLDPRPALRMLAGAALVAGPGALHRADLADLLARAGGDPALAASLATAAWAVAWAALPPLLVRAAWRGEGARVAGLSALALAPPLIGFALGFLLLHALPQGRRRRERLGFADDRAYLSHVAPVLLAALAGSAAVAAWWLARGGEGTRGLFAVVAALAVPHMAVTPWFAGEREPTRPVALRTA